jgi:hypothetical protein
MLEPDKPSNAGELMERLGTRANIDVDWIGMKQE